MLITHILNIKFILIKFFFMYLFGKPPNSFSKQIFLRLTDFCWGKQYYKNEILLFELNV